MSFLYLTGSAFNRFARGTVTASPSAATGYSASNIGNSDPSEPLIFGSLSADSYCQVTINALTNPGFETSTLSGWTAGSAGTGTSARRRRRASSATGRRPRLPPARTHRTTVRGIKHHCKCGRVPEEPRLHQDHK